MNQTMPRLGAVCGIAYAVLVLAGASAGVEQIELAGLVLLIPFVAYLSTLLGGWLGITALGAGLVGTALKMASVVPWVARDEHDKATPVYAALDDMSTIATVVMMYPLVIVVAAVALAAFGSSVFPRWVGGFSALVAVGLAVNSTMLETTNVPAYPLFLLWALVLGVRLLIRPAPAPRVAPAPG